MDISFWAAGFHSSKHVSAARANNPGNYINMEEEAGDKVRSWFPCPFCLLDIELPLLCMHMQEEHCFDPKNAVCPICAANLGKEALDHFTLQHPHSIKRRRSPQKPGFWSNISAADFRELSSFLGGNNINSNNNSVGKSKNEPGPDPILSPFISAAIRSKDLSEKNRKEYQYLGFPEKYDGDGDEERSKRAKEDNCGEKKQRAKFMQELLLSTIFSA